MTVSAKVSAVPGIEAASVVMASATNVENLARAGLGDFAVRPNDLVVAVSGTAEACAEALRKADELLSAKAGGGNDKASAVQQPITSIQMAVAKDPAHNFALISVPGDYAASEAMKALRLDAGLIGARHGNDEIVRANRKITQPGPPEVFHVGGGGHDDRGRFDPWHSRNLR